MEASTGTNNKRQLFAGYESPTEEPPEKIVKVKEDETNYPQKLLQLQRKLLKMEQNDQPNPSQEVVVLQRKLHKMEQDFQRVCRIANEYESGMNLAKARVEELESFIDNKPKAAAVDEEKKESDNKRLLEKLKENTKRLDEAYKKLQSAAVKDKANAEEIVKLKVTISAVKSGAERSKYDAADRVKRLQQSVELLTEQLNVAKEKAIKSVQTDQEVFSNLARKHHEELHKIKLERERDHAKITLLTRKLASLQSNKISPVSTVGAPMTRAEGVRTRSAVQKRDDTSNLFLMLDTDAPNSITYSSAAEVLHARYHGKDQKWRQQWADVVGTAYPLVCGACLKTINNPNILLHFFSLNHAQRVRTMKVNVSLVAVEYWLDKLKLVPVEEKEEEQADESANIGEKPDTNVMMLDEDVPD